MKKNKIKSILIENAFLFIGGGYLAIQCSRVIEKIGKFDISKMQLLLNKVMGQIALHPFIIPTKEELKFLPLLGTAFIIFTMNRINKIKNYMKDTAYGSSKWADIKQIQKKFSGKKNLVLSQNVRLNTDTRKTNVNDNVMLLGSSGSGKTRYYVKPNIMESCLKNVWNGFIVTDPKKELLIETGKLLKDSGYDVKVLDLKDWEGNCWNPFNYFYEDEDVLSFVKSLIKNTNGETNGDKFWENASILLFNAVFFYLIEKCPIEDRNLVNVKKLINLCSVKEEEEDHISTLDIMFNKLEEENPNSKAVGYYKSFKMGSGKTLKSIIISCLANLNFIGLEKVDRTLSGKDEFDLENIGYNKTTVFITMSDVDTAYNFLGSMFIDQMLNAMIKKRDKERNKPYVHMLLDEFAQLGTLNNFPERISVIRSRNISVTIVLQSIQQLKANYKDKDEIIIENCNTKVVLATSESAKWVSEKLGKQTIDNQTTSKSYGRNKSNSTNNSQISRNLLDANEVEQLDNSKEIIIIKGSLPILDNKYDITKHKLYKKLGDVNDDSNKNNYYLNKPLKNKNNSSLDNMIKDILENENKNIMEELINDLKAEDVEIDGNAAEEELMNLEEELMNEFSDIVG